MITKDLATIYRMTQPTQPGDDQQPGDVIAIAATTTGPCDGRAEHIWRFARELRAYGKTTYEYACERCYARYYGTGDGVRETARAAKAQQAMAANGGGKILDMGEHMGRRERREAERNRRKVVAKMQRADPAHGPREL